MPLKREIIATPHAPAAIGPYSQAVQVGDLIYTAGQITLQVMQNLARILEAAGSSLAHAVKTTIFVTNLADFAAINKVYGSFFAGDPPARSTVQVAALPLDANIEIEVVAIYDKHSRF
jgi:2-iminobutanoate/2-iminopropanoate deaminase